MATRNLLHDPTPSHIGAEGAARQESVKCAGSAGRRAALISASSPTRRKRMTDRLVPVPFLERPTTQSTSASLVASCLKRLPTDTISAQGNDRGRLLQRGEHRGQSDSAPSPLFRGCRALPSDGALYPRHNSGF